MSYPLIRLEKVCGFFAGNAWKSKGFSTAPNGIPVIRIQNVCDDVGDLIYWAGEYDPRYIVRDGDILLSLSGNIKLSVWKRENALLNQRVVKLIPSEQADRSYFYWAISRAIDEIASMAKHAVIANVSMGDLRELQIPLPPLPEQKRIAAILDKADAIRRKRQQAVKLTEELLRSVFLDMFGDPVTNPKGWKEVTIRDLVTEVKYGTSDKASYEGKYSILRMNNITYKGSWDFRDLKRINIPEKDLPKYLVCKGDILFNRTNSKELVGKTAVYRQDFPMAYAGYLIRVRPNQQNNSEYIAAYLNSAHGKKILENMCKNIVGMANINAQELQEIPILQPPPELQNQYAAVVHSVEKTKVKLIASSDTSNTLFTSLLQRAFRGEL